MYRSLTIIAYALLVIEVLFGFVTGERTQMLIPAIILISFVGMGKSLRISPAVALLVPLLIMVIGVTTVLRGIPDPGAPIGERMEYTYQQSLQEGPQGLFDLGVSNLSVRYHGLDSISAVLALPRMDAPSHGLTYVTSVIGPLVPRFVWPDKPRIALGRDFGWHYFDVYRENNTSLAATWFGDLAIQFPLAIVPIIAMGIGWGIAWLRARSIEQGSSSVFAVIFVMLMPVLFTPNDWLSSTLYLATLRVVVVLAGIGILTVVSRGDQTKRVVQTRSSMNPLHGPSIADV
jgi:hypothetical protein